MNVAQPKILTTYLSRKGHINPDEEITIRELSGGVSCLTLLIVRNEGPNLVIKQALTKLKVKEDWFSDPKRIHIEAAAMLALQKITPAGSVPKLLFEDQEHHLLGMEAVALPHENWKTLLLQGRVDLRHVKQFAQIIAGIHRHSLQKKFYQKTFEDRHFFETLRLEPYYSFTAGQVPEAVAFLERLIEDTAAVQLSLVHGDYSPKNILIYQNRLVLLDHEVMHFGDGAFDIGFSMTHLLSKALHVPEHKQTFKEAAMLYWLTYNKYFSVTPDWEKRAVRHTLACMLARVRGKSPLEYLSDEEKDRQEELSLKLIKKIPASMIELINNSLPYTFKERTN